MNTNWHYAWSKPTVKGDFKTYDQDFYVEEVLGFEPDGKGEFCFVLIEKQGVNTDYLAKRLAEISAIPYKSVTYSGVKDRHACTRQWFCLHVLNKEPDLLGIQDVFKVPESVRLIDVKRHSKKLRTGTHKANRFVLRLRDIEGDAKELIQRLQLIKKSGVPNYYGAQRFGINGNNLHRGREFVLKGRQNSRKLSKTESFWLSAIRSWCFNEALSCQIEQGIWHQLYHGDIAQFSDRDEQFRVKSLSPEVYLNLMEGIISPVLPLMAEGWEDGTTQKRARIMKEALIQETDLIHSLMSFGLSRDSRPTRLMPTDMAWELLEKQNDRTQLILEFSLPKGSFATSILREMMDVTDKSVEKYHENIDRK